MAKRKFRVTGRVIDRKSRSGVPGLRVEAWDKDLVFDDLVGSTVTDVQGAFLIEFDEGYFKELFFDRRPDLFFKVFHGERLVHSTEDSVLWNVSAEVTEVVIEGDFARLKPVAPGVITDKSFAVSGTVRLRDGGVQRRQRVVAFNLDLRGVADYRRITDLGKIRAHSGFEFLGNAVSDVQGRYEISFFHRQQGEDERTKADVVVYAVAGEEVIGRSRMANSEDYSDKGQVSNLDIVITRKDASTEYEKLMKALTAFLEENKTTLGEIALSSDQLHFIAGQLDLDLAQVKTAASAELLLKGNQESLSHELLYGAGRQNVTLSWVALSAKSDDALQMAIAQSVDERIIRTFSGEEIAVFLRRVRAASVKNLLENSAGGKAVDTILAHALPEQDQRLSFVSALRSFKGNDFRKFWDEHLPAQPEFKDQPNLIANLLLTQQLLLIGGNHAPLLTELQANRKVSSTKQLFDLDASDWQGIIAKTGVPDFVEGKDAAEKIENYAKEIQGSLNTAFPTQRVARMLERDELPIEKTTVNRSLQTFLAQNENFDISQSRIHEFDQQIEAVAGKDAGQVKTELKKIQRTFQVSPSPEAMSVLLANNLHSAAAIATIPQKSFIRIYSDALGGEDVAFAVYERASHISTRTEFMAMQFMEYSGSATPTYVAGPSDMTGAVATIENQVPNYTELFGGPDICDCEQCNSVYSAAAYFVDLLRFLWRSVPNADAKSPLDTLKKRRPDLLHLPLTCENTNTIIPYIDLANEVMEYYTAHGSLTSFEGYDTGETTTEELRANPQNFNLEAYRKLKDARYPFTLPFHQPLDVIRTFSEYLGVSRYEAMKAINPAPDATTKRAIEAESLALCQEEYKILTDRAFDGTPDPTPLHEYFGYTSATNLENLSAVREFLRRSGLAYTDLVELVKTSFINPFQGTLDFLQDLFSAAAIDSNALYARLGAIEAGTLNPADDADIVAALSAHNSSAGTSVTITDLAQWITTHLREFRQVITLYEPQSKCDLDTTSLRTIRSIYEALPTSGITDDDNDTWSKFHRFIRLWRKLGWSIHETDLMLAALGEPDLIPATITKLESVALLRNASRLDPSQLAVFWGNIDSYGNKSLYKKLFLNRAVQQIDEAFKADAWGNYLQTSETLGAHQSAILAAFRITEEELSAILDVARVIDAGGQRRLVLATDVLNIQNLSTIYRYVMMAKGLKLRVTDLCTLIRLFGATPFSIWDLVNNQFTGALPADTYAFYELAAATSAAGFKSAVLEYILQGTLPADSNIGLDQADILQTAKDLRAAFVAIEQDHPKTPAAPLTAAVLIAELSLTFSAEIVTSFIGILENTKSFETRTDANLNVVIPNDENQAAVNALVAAGAFAAEEKAATFLKTLSAKYSYVNGSGRLTCAGTMSDQERDFLKGLANVNANFANAVDELYEAPETFIATHFSGIFDNLSQAKAKLVDHPAQLTATTPDEKLAYVYERFTPILKSKMRHDTLAHYIAALIGLSEAATALLISADAESLIAALSAAGFSAEYFSDMSWATSVLRTTDATIDFSLGAGSPAPLVPADSFSVRWEAYLAAPASGAYTLRVEVEEADEVFNLYLDEALILQKTAAMAGTAWEVVVDLNAAEMSRVKLEYAEDVQNAGVRLSWKTATTAREVVPASVVYPAVILDNFIQQVAVYHRAAEFVLGFQLSETELNHLIEFKADFGGINFKALDVGAWRRIYDYTTLKDSVPQAQALLTDVFVLANTANPAPTVDALRARLHLATAWDEASLKFMVDIHFALTQADFKNEIKLNRLLNVMKIVSTSGLSATTIASWGKAETNFDVLNTISQLLKNSVKAKYEDADWLQLAGDLNDKIRERQKNSLIAYLLTRPDIQNWGARDADGLFEYFLIDVQMGACMDTSRIVQANASVQMFVSRCLLNLESDMATGAEKGVSPGSIDRERWEWMKNYRVWEANRKVFLYPENWLEPEWRNDRSEFFKELESYLVQNDITDRSAEQAFRNYLTSLNQVANLEVCGTHRENYNARGTDGKLHVIARTHTAPYKFFYRTWNEYRKWSAWEKVPLDIRCIDEGANSGVHVVPLVWKKRLFLFWIEFMEKQHARPMGNQTVEGAAGQLISSMEPQTYWEVRLAWSERVDDKWTPKQVTKEFLNQHRTESVARPADLLFTASINANDELSITVSDGFWNLYRGDFTLSDIQSPVRANDSVTREIVILGVGTGVIIEPVMRYEVESSIYRYQFSKRVALGSLKLKDDVYLSRVDGHYLLPVDTFRGLNINLDHPFFFGDNHRAYFVRPVSIEIRELIKDPKSYGPFFQGLVDDSRYTIPTEIPHYEPDDYIPVELIDPSIDVGRAAFVARDSEASSQLLIGFADTGRVGPIVDSRGSLSGGIATALRPANVTTTIATSAGAATTKAVSIVASAASEAGSTAAVVAANSVGRAFGYYATGVGFGGFTYTSRPHTGLEFHTFYHPFSSRYVTNLNRDGLPGLMESDTTIRSDGGLLFENYYFPNFTNRLVQKPTDFSSGTYYKENVCFWPYGANSLYNMELFFHAPLYIATRLSKNGQFEEARKWFHYIFDPTTDDMPLPGETEISRYWKVLPFKTTPAESLEDWFRVNLSAVTDPRSRENEIIGEWRDNPFDPHLVASNRPLAYMKNVVVKYVENLIAWGDSLFRQDTMESVNEALQIYVIANHILGPRPEFVPKRGEIRAESYQSLSAKWDDFSNALVELENIFPYSSEVSVSERSPGSNLLGIGPSFYFCIPSNDKLLKLWDTVADRLFKIRHCQNLEGVERHLALFAPAIDPGALIQAASQGLSLGSILADLSSPPPIYRFATLLQRANEFCGEVKALGSALLATLEKKDGEELSRLRASHETQMLELLTAIKQRQVLDARVRKENLEKTRATATFRLGHYLALLGDDLKPPPAPSISATLSADSELPADTLIAEIKVDVDDSLVESGESGVKLLSKEKQQLDKNDAAKWFTLGAGLGEALSGIFHLFPQLDGEGTPFGVGLGAWWGGQNLGPATSALARVASATATHLSQEAAQAGVVAGYIRREQDWTLQANLAAKEIIQIDKQITSADIQIQVAERELENQQQQILNSQQVEQFLKDKFTNQELYQWMKEQLFAVYKQSYNLAFDLARKAEKAYKYEMGTETASFIQYGYWDNSKQGLVSGEKLQLALRQLEKSHLEENRRELELNKSVSLELLNPLALIELKETGRCYISLPEEMFDLDFPGHYFRRIKSVSLSIPCVSGPYTAVNCSLRLLSNNTRISTSMNSQGKYEHENDEGLWIDDDRFRSSNVPVTSIATSTALNDTGLFEFNFRDERYLPFEGAGAISSWVIELSSERDLRQFDYSTISDVILHVKFTARESGGLFKAGAVTYIKNFIMTSPEHAGQPLVRGFSMKHEFPTEWHRFLRPGVAGAEQVLSFTIGKERFPFFTRNRNIVVMKIEVLARCTKDGDYTTRLTLRERAGRIVPSGPVTMATNSSYGGLKKATLNGRDAGLDLEKVDVGAAMSLKIQKSGAADFTGLGAEPDEVEDLFLIVHYQVANATAV